MYWYVSYFNVVIHSCVFIFIKQTCAVHIKYYYKHIGSLKGMHICHESAY